MSAYLLNFIVYTTAMIGIIFLAVFVYKKFSVCTTTKSKFLDVEDCVSLAPRKNLYVIKAGGERFLVASDAERTTLISKLGENSVETVQAAIKQTTAEAPDVIDLKQAREPKKVFKNMMSKL